MPDETVVEIGLDGSQKTISGSPDAKDIRIVVTGMYDNKSKIKRDKPDNNDVWQEQYEEQKRNSLTSIDETLKGIHKTLKGKITKKEDDDFGLMSILGGLGTGALAGAGLPLLGKLLGSKGKFLTKLVGKGALGKGGLGKLFGFSDDVAKAGVKAAADTTVMGGVKAAADTTVMGGVKTKAASSTVKAVGKQTTKAASKSILPNMTKNLFGLGKGALGGTIVGGIIAGIVDGVLEYAQTGDMGEAIVSAIGAGGGTILGSALGGAIGTVFLGPIGGLIGTFIGGIVGDWVGGSEFMEDLLGSIFDPIKEGANWEEFDNYDVGNEGFDWGEKLDTLFDAAFSAIKNTFSNLDSFGERIDEYIKSFNDGLVDFFSENDAEDDKHWADFADPKEQLSRLSTSKREADQIMYKMLQEDEEKFEEIYGQRGSRGRSVLKEYRKQREKNGGIRPIQESDNMGENVTLEIADPLKNSDNNPPMKDISGLEKITSNTKEYQDKLSQLEMDRIALEETKTSGDVISNVVQQNNVNNSKKDTGMLVQAHEPKFQTATQTGY